MNSLAGPRRSPEHPDWADALLCLTVPGHAPTTTRTRERFPDSGVDVGAVAVALRPDPGRDEVDAGFGEGAGPVYGRSCCRMRLVGHGEGPAVVEVS